MNNIVNSNRKKSLDSLITENKKEEETLTMQKSSHCFLVKLLIAYEGTSRGKILIDGVQGYAIEKFWGRARIEELVEKLSSNLVPVYLFHSSPRQKVGEVIESWVEEFNNRLNALILARIKDSEVCDLIRRIRLDTCSLEAELVFKRIGDIWLVDKVEEVSGVALGSRDLVKPGFSDARIITFWDQRDFIRKGLDKLRNFYYNRFRVV